jgi:hypothetical protein
LFSTVASAKLRARIVLSFLVGNSSIGSDGKFKPVFSGIEQVRAGAFVLVHHESARATIVAVLVDTDVPLTTNVFTAFRIKPVFSNKGLQKAFMKTRI